MLVLMRKRVALLLIGLIAGVAVACAQNVPVGVVVALKKGNPQGLDRYLGEKVNVIIQKQNSDVDKATAYTTLETFFHSNPVKGFEVRHEGQREGSSFVVGVLKTDNGDFRVNCFFKRIQNRYFIHQIRIEKNP